ncbi:hypothetical protein [uncultured Bacteroides sp.]|uniref:hypothetical protein n=1 Tax=uncultured Bacteroides sp. TaxID=162156 RepID=UPI00262D0AA4|nr:hypothetical protein [uncultured Bacteroides sp.]
MGCIRVNIEASKGINVNTSPLYGINVSVNPSRSIKVSVGVVCDVGKDAYLTVNPDYIWLMPSNNFEDNVDVLSNVVWTTATKE